VSHIDPDDLALIALGVSSPTGAQRAHLDECTECSREVRELGRTAEVAKVADRADLMTPPATAWSGIHHKLGLSVALSDSPIAPAAVAEPARLAAPVRPPLTAVPRSSVTAAGIPRDSRVPRRVWPLLVAAALVGVVGGLGIGALSGYLGDRVSVVAEAVLDPLPGQDVTGIARVEENPDGRRDVVVTVGDGADAVNPTDGSLREVWLLNSDATGLVSLGLLDGTSGRFVIPAGVNLDEYPLVDVSVESADGNPGHSGISVVRGQLHST
jgi:hypothetical protein